MSADTKLNLLNSIPEPILKEIHKNDQGIKNWFELPGYIL
jgi:hypothetical protein